MSHPPRSPVWRAWLLLMVAVWVNFAPRASAGAQVATARVGLSVTDGLPSVVGVHKYLYANADPVGMFDPTGNAALAQFTTAMAIAFNLGIRMIPVAMKVTWFGAEVAGVTTAGLGVGAWGGRNRHRCRAIRSSRRNDWRSTSHRSEIRERRLHRFAPLRKENACWNWRPIGTPQSNRRRFPLLLLTTP
jgi:hypothetical protein